MGGRGGRESARANGSRPGISSEALPMQPAFTKVRRSMIPSGLIAPICQTEPRGSRPDYASASLVYNSPGAALFSALFIEDDNLVACRYTFASTQTTQRPGRGG